MGGVVSFGANNMNQGNPAGPFAFEIFFKCFGCYHGWNCTQRPLSQNGQTIIMGLTSQMPNEVIEQHIDSIRTAGIDPISGDFHLPIASK